MLSERVLLRYNDVRHRTELHWLSQGPVIGEDEQGLLTIFGDDGGVTDGYQNLTDRDVNTLWRELCREKPVVKQHLQNVIESDYVPRYMPFRYYLEHLPPWTPEQGDAIMGLSLTVNVKGGSDEQLSQPFDHDAIFAQAYALYRQGFRYWFDRPEIERLQRHNEQFETPQSELELVDLHFRKPTANEPRELISATMALQLIGGNLALTLSKEKIGQAFMRLGFEYRRKSAQRGYIAVHRTGVEMEQYRRFLAEERTVTDDGMTAVW